MPYDVRVLPRAEFDVQQIYNWLSERSPEGARRWWLAFEETVAGIKQQPSGLALAPEAKWIDRELRQLLFKTAHGRYYRALYVIVENEVRVLRVRGPGQPELVADELT